MPIWDNQMSIPDQSHANPVPIRFQSRANFTPIQGHSLDQSKINQIHLFANLSKSNANPLPILCQSKVNFSMNLFQSLPIHANPSQSNANFVPFTRAIPALNQGTSPPWRLVSSPLGGQIQGKRAFPILTNPFKCWPAYANPGQPNCQSLANP